MESPSLPGQQTERCGRCASCGFLGVLADAGKIPPSFSQASDAMRLGGEFGAQVQERAVGLTWKPGIPACFLSKANLRAEVRQPWATQVRHEDRDDWLKVLNGDRRCPHWMAYMPGLTPKEHFDQRVLESMERERERFERDQSELTRKFAKRLHREMVTLTVIATLLGVAFSIANLSRDSLLGRLILGDSADAAAKGSPSDDPR